MTKLGIIGAMDVEVAILKEKMTEKSVTNVGKMAFFQGKLAGCDVVVAQCGVGKVHAAMCAQTLCDRFGVTHLVNTGIAGSLDNELDIGDVLVSRDVMQHDFDCYHFGYPMCKIPGLDVTAFPADEGLIAMAFEASEALKPGHTKIGRVATGDQFVASQELKDRIIDRTGANCTEMEGGAIAQVAYVNQVPFVILRAISDKADNSAEMDYPTFERLAAEHCAAVTEALAKKMAE
ncbi:MAG: 5'-methylthioadenosine/adenosylhomocysteine nucleosidase [Oscillospiraceae bacterium]|nr:5'-methylthioadenosine/adenosylhomocysteine nucleosidase [Oscillospiraceae bacterium]